MARLGDREWDELIDRFIDWATFLDVSPGKAFRLFAKLFKEEHFGVERVILDHWEDYGSSMDEPTMQYLNMGDTYSTTLVLTDDYVNGVKLLKTSWGDWYEETERYHDEQFGYCGCGYCGHRNERVEGVDWDEQVCLYCQHHLDGSKVKPKSYVIEDWTGARKFPDKIFSSMQDGHDFLLETFENDEDLQEFYVVEKQE